MPGCMSRDMTRLTDSCIETLILRSFSFLSLSLLLLDPRSSSLALSLSLHFDNDACLSGVASRRRARDKLEGERLHN